MAMATVVATITDLNIVMFEGNFVKGQPSRFVGTS